MSASLPGLFKVCVIAVMVALAGGRAVAQDLVKVEPTQAKVLLENQRVRVLEVTVKVGEKQAMHAHPDHLVYPFTAYKVKHISPNGKTMVGERKPGEVVWIAAESHAGENVGTTVIRPLIVELKEPPRGK